MSAMGDIAKSAPAGPEDNEKVAGQLALTDFTIGAFRGLQHVHLRDLARINLLVGGNDSGKTSVLEALAVFAAPLNVVAWAEIALLREEAPSFAGQEMPPGVEAIRWLFPSGEGDDQPGSLQLSAEGRVRFRSLTATCTPLHTLLQNQSQPAPGPTGGAEGYRIAVTPWPPLTGAAGTIATDLWQGAALTSEPPQPQLPAVFLPASVHAHRSALTGQLSQQIAGGKKAPLIQALQKFDHEILDIFLRPVPRSGAPCLMVRHARAGTVPVRVLGDGFRRILAIALSLPLASGGLLLLDGLETALHAHLFEKLFDWLVPTCHQSNVQLFATTQSLEAVAWMVKAALRLPEPQISAYRVSVRDGANTVKRYDSDMLNRVVLEHGLDIR